jgi:sulfatase maturation enzyme AslB (radical SAM superfamily)
MCYSGSSSKWIADEIALGKTPYALNRHSVSDLTVDLTFVDRIYFKGGEPSLEQDTIIDILQHIELQKGSLSAMWIKITTNGLVLLNDKLMSLLDKCRLVELSVSVDGIGKINDYQRSGANWETIEQNLFLYQDICGANFRLELLTAWTYINVNSSIELMQWVINKLPRFSMHGEIVTSPAYFSPRNMPSVIKNTILDKLTAWDKYDSTVWVMRNKSILTFELNLNQVISIEKVRNNIAALDNIRDENFAQIDLEVYLALFS